MGPFSAQELAKDVIGEGDRTGLGRAKLLRSQLGISFSSCRIMMVSMTKKRSQGSQRVCSCVMKGARSNRRVMEMPPFVTKSKLFGDAGRGGERGEGEEEERGRGKRGREKRKKNYTKGSENWLRETLKPEGLDWSPKQGQGLVFESDHHREFTKTKPAIESHLPGQRTAAEPPFAVVLLEIRASQS